MTGDKAKIMAVWRELCGDPTYEEENLDEVWAVQLGTTTEARVTSNGMRRVNAAQLVRPWCCCYSSRLFLGRCYYLMDLIRAFRDPSIQARLRF